MTINTWYVGFANKFFKYFFCELKPGKFLGIEYNQDVDGLVVDIWEYGHQGNEEEGEPYKRVDMFLARTMVVEFIFEREEFFK